MGRLTYGGTTGTTLEFDDRLLAHLQAVILAKLRRDEKFSFTCQHGPAGYTSIWVHPAIPLVFTFDAAERPVLSRQWIEVLMHSANGGGGLTVIPEPEPVPR